MSTRKTIGGALGAIIVLIVAQILAQLVASLFVFTIFSSIFATKHTLFCAFCLCTIQGLVLSLPLLQRY